MNEEELYVKPSRHRVHSKPDREVHVKDRVPKQVPYKRPAKNIKQELLKGKIEVTGDE